METQEQQTLDSLVKQSIERAITSDAIKERVQAATDKAVSESIDSVFSYNSDFRNGIKKAIAAALPTVDVTDLACLSHSVRHLIQKRLATLASETAAEHVGKVLGDLLPEGNVIAIKQLKEAYEEKLRGLAIDEECYCEIRNELVYSWNIERSSLGSGGYFDLWMSPHEDASRYGGKDVVTLRFKPVGDGLYECWNANAGYGDVGVNSLFVGPLYGFDAMVFRLGTRLAKLSMEQE